MEKEAIRTEHKDSMSTQLKRQFKYVQLRCHPDRLFKASAQERFNARLALNQATFIYNTLSAKQKYGIDGYKNELRRMQLVFKCASLPPKYEVDFEDLSNEEAKIVKDECYLQLTDQNGKPYYYCYFSQSNNNKVRIDINKTVQFFWDYKRILIVPLLRAVLLNENHEGGKEAPYTVILMKEDGKNWERFAWIIKRKFATVWSDDINRYIVERWGVSAWFPIGGRMYEIMSLRNDGQAPTVEDIILTFTNGEHPNQAAVIRCIELLKSGGINLPYNRANLKAVLYGLFKKQPKDKFINKTVSCHYDHNGTDYIMRPSSANEYLYDQHLFEQIAHENLSLVQIIRIVDLWKYWNISDNNSEINCLKTELTECNAKLTKSYETIQDLKKINIALDTRVGMHSELLKRQTKTISELESRLRTTQRINISSMHSHNVYNTHSFNTYTYDTSHAAINAFVSGFPMHFTSDEAIKCLSNTLDLEIYETGSVQLQEGSQWKYFKQIRLKNTQILKKLLKERYIDVHWKGNDVFLDLKIL